MNEALSYLKRKECDGIQRILIEKKDEKFIIYLLTWEYKVIKIEATNVELLDYENIKEMEEMLERNTERIMGGEMK